MKYYTHTFINKLLTVFLLLFSLFPFSRLKSQTTLPPGIQFVMVTFDQAPTMVTVEKAPLRYNKRFAVSFHADDGIFDLYTVAFPFFTGVNSGTTNHPGLFYTDGCGNDISFKLSSSLFSWSGFNNEDMHQPGNGYGALTWPQLSIMYQNGCAIFNHGFTSDAFTDLEFMNYSIQRNESFIKRRLLETTEGGVQTRVFVNPNGAEAYTAAAFNLGYDATFRMGSQAVIPNNGLNVNSFTLWNQPLELNRALAESVNVQSLADQLMANSIDGANFWMPVFTHRIIEDYPQTAFFNDFNYIAATYGKTGQDNVWVASEEEIINYQMVKQATTINHGVSGNSLLITFSGAIPTDFRFYPLSLVVKSDAIITNIAIIGGTSTSFNGIGQSDALINLSWDGNVVIDNVTLADSYVTKAEQNPTQYNALIAMDYVYMVPAGPERDALKNRLCSIPNVTLDPGFCTTCDFTLGDDIDLCSGNCVTLQAPEATGTSYLWSNGATTSSVTVCPVINTTYIVTITTSDNCVASDTLKVNILPSPVFELGPDLARCQGEIVTIEGPVNTNYTYSWYSNGNLLPETTSTLELLVQDTVSIKLSIKDINDCIASDSLTVNAWEFPIINVLPETASLCVGGALNLTASAQFAESLIWWNDIQGTTNQFFAETPGIYKLWARATNGFGCASADTSTVTVNGQPEIQLQIVQGSASVCTGDTVRMKVSAIGATPINRVVWNNTDTIPMNGQTEVFQSFILNQTTSIKATGLTASGCSDSKSTTINVTAKPAITISPDVSICSGITTTLQAQGGAQCAWYLQGVQVGTGYTIAVSPATTSKYYARITDVEPTFCTAVDTVKVTVNQLPIVEILSSAQEVCKGSPVTLTASGASTYLWSNNQSGSQITVNPIVNTTYSVVGTSAFGCNSNAIIQISVFPSSEVSIIGLLPVYCQTDSPVTLIGQPVGGLFSGPGIISNIFKPSIAGPGGHKIVYSYTNDFECVDKDTVNTFVIGFDMLIDLGPDSLICPANSITLDAGDGFSSYQWSTGHTTQQITIQGTSYQPGTSRIISVVGILNGCVAAGSMDLTIKSDCYIGFFEIEDKKPYTIAPNPSSGSFKIKWNKPVKDVSLNLFDLKGQSLLQQKNITDLGINQELSIAAPSSHKGLFLLYLYVDQSVYISKILVE